MSPTFAWPFDLRGRVVVPPADAEPIAAVARLLGGPAVTLVGAEGTEARLPAAASEVLALAADAMSRGMAVDVSPLAARLTTGEAADLLGVSRPTIVKLLESGAIPFEKTTSHRRVRMDDVLAYRERRRAERQATLDAMTRRAIEDWLYDAQQIPPDAGVTA